MSDIWIVLIEDSSVDFDALPFSTEERAVEVAREQVLAHAAQSRGHQLESRGRR